MASVFSVLKFMSPGQVLADPHILFISVYVFCHVNVEVLTDWLVLKSQPWPLSKKGLIRINFSLSLNLCRVAKSHWILQQLSKSKIEPFLCFLRCLEWQKWSDVDSDPIVDIYSGTPATAVSLDSVVWTCTSQPLMVDQSVKEKFH